MRMAGEMQALALKYIEDAFESDEDISLNSLTYDRFIDALDTARQSGPEAEAELNRQLAKIVHQAIQQAMSAPPPGAQPGQGQAPPPPQGAQ